MITLSDKTDAEKIDLFFSCDALASELNLELNIRTQTKMFEVIDQNDGCIIFESESIAGVYGFLVNEERTNGK